jgi:hypothetical protein
MTDDTSIRRKGLRLSVNNARDLCGWERKAWGIPESCARPSELCRAR